MIYLIISILCSVSVGVLFKLIRKKTTVNLFLICINYFVAAGLSLLIFKPEVSFEIVTTTWQFIIPLMILLPTVFLALPKAIQHSGIVKTDIAQRMSLIIPILCSTWIFHEIIPDAKKIALFLGFIAILLILQKPDNKQKSNYWYLGAVFLGYGIIDVLFKQVALLKVAPYTTQLFYIFCGAFLFSITLFFLQKKHKKLHKSYYLYGAILGLLNFANIYFYLKAHQYFTDTPTTVFAIMNFGVISLGTLIGIVVFKEKLSKINYFGLLLAFIAITFIVLQQLNFL